MGTSSSTVSAERRFEWPNSWALVAGPEIFGETAFHAPSTGEAGSEALLTGRFERTGYFTEPADNLKLVLNVTPK
jgi:hypothetical protein